ncbi:hypothetical protein C446_07452 [Halobiforma nitratireducens JCM 10879]|uniref:Uncharacterized protein n=1 Tax=Halobiforma nitratireducens JCM 10879 TaxID=1227454 RepID=M0M344_9EURY|nr:hypothetical protein C446_07452 [Halobiforma nitratireducens JCM 10879]
MKLVPYRVGPGRQRERCTVIVLADLAEFVYQRYCRSEYRYRIGHRVSTCDFETISVVSLPAHPCETTPRFDDRFFGLG